jgi:hypothetical protein
MKLLKGKLARSSLLERMKTFTFVRVHSTANVSALMCVTHMQSASVFCLTLTHFFPYYYYFVRQAVFTPCLFSQRWLLSELFLAALLF